ncbi:DUF2314 domain-containing protein [Pedobacter sp. KLB.chiD]|uniref:DUF2314 domain-containing protein n=1 Tax=Pedobacter sp. KLB.chiD TaxID=3387402 RepID=UPI00399BFEE5
METKSININREYLYYLYKAEKSKWFFIEALANRTNNYKSVKILNSDNVLIWLEDLTIDDNTIQGYGSEDHQLMRVEIKDIVDWMIVDNNKLIGGYTIRYYRQTLNDDDRTNFDIEFGLKIDDGNDFFYPDFSTPEGVIIQLEMAYNAKSIEGILECKDLIMEAKNVLNYTNYEISDDLLSETADLLKTSIIENINHYGFPEFTDVERSFTLLDVKDSGKQKLISEKLIFSDGTSKTNRFWVGLNKNDEWKVLDLVE